MPIIACGINHKTAPVALREKVVFQSEKLALYLQDLIAHESIREAVLLSTCNRSELYCDVEDVSSIVNWFCRQHQITYSEIQPAWYCYENHAAVEHIMQVACGLDSMVLGETQILGQMKQAFSESCAAGSVGPQFNRLFQQVFSVAKEVRTNTSIGACPVSIASAAVSLAKQIFGSSMSEMNFLLIGGGDTIQLVLRHLQTQSIKIPTIANRNLNNALTLAEQFSGKGVSFLSLTEELQTADIVISATSSATPIVTKTMLANRTKPIVIIDIAVPRDVEAEVSFIPSVQLYSIDDLKSIIQHNLRGREHAAEKAQQVIAQRSSEFIAWLHSIDQVATTIRAYRKQIEDLCDAELSKALRQLQRGDDPVQVLAAFSHALVNKLLHNPSVQLRQAGVEGRFDLLELAQQLFAIPQPETL